ncbi:MAG: hypothetical protein ACP5D8_06250 [Fidelibacterota bacterium]
MTRRGSIKRYFFLFKWKRRLTENEIKQTLDEAYHTIEILEERDSTKPHNKKHNKNFGKFNIIY